MTSPSPKQGISEMMLYSDGLHKSIPIESDNLAIRFTFRIITYPIYIARMWSFVAFMTGEFHEPRLVDINTEEFLIVQGLIDMNIGRCKIFPTQNPSIVKLKQKDYSVNLCYAVSIRSFTQTAALQLEFVIACFMQIFLSTCA